MPRVTVGRRSTALILAGAFIVGGCRTSSPSETRAASVYEAILRWFAERRSDDPEPLPIFIEPRGEGAGIDLAVQAELIELTSDYATARFIDSREEAILETDEADDEHAIVRDDGVLVRLDPVLEDRPVTVDVDEYVDHETLRTLRFRLTSTRNTWQVVGEPADVSSS